MHANVFIGGANTLEQFAVYYSTRKKCEYKKTITKTLPAIRNFSFQLFI